MNEPEPIHLADLGRPATVHQRIDDLQKRVAKLELWQMFCFGVSAAVGALVGFAFAVLGTGVLQQWK